MMGNDLHTDPQASTASLNGSGCTFNAISPNLPLTLFSFLDTRDGSNAGRHTNASLFP